MYCVVCVCVCVCVCVRVCVCVCMCVCVLLIEKYIQITNKVSVEDTLYLDNSSGTEGPNGQVVEEHPDIT